MGRERIVPEQFKDRNIYSISRLTTFHNCQYSYFLQYIQKNRGKQNVYAELGTTVHDCLEQMQVGKMTKEEALKKFEQSLLQCELNDMKFPSEKIAENFIKNIKHFLNNYEPMDCKKVLLEKEFYTEINGNVLMGYIDAILLNHDGTIEVVDYKTSTKYSAKDLDEHGLQLVLYAIALEQEFGVPIKAVKWNMLKYCIIEFEGATKPRTMFAERNKWVEKLKSELLKDLRKCGYNELQIETTLERAIQENSLESLPEHIQNKYVVKDGFIEYPLDNRTRMMLVKFLTDTIANIESMPKEQENAWIAKDIDKEGSFFCGTLCGHSKTCKFYKQFLEKNSSSFKPREDIIDSLFK